MLSIRIGPSGFFSLSRQSPVRLLLELTLTLAEERRYNGYAHF